MSELISGTRWGYNWVLKTKSWKQLKKLVMVILISAEEPCFVYGLVPQPILVEKNSLLPSERRLWMRML